MKEPDKNQALRDLPSVNDVLHLSEIQGLVDEYGREPVKRSVREAIDRARSTALKGGEVPNAAGIASSAIQWLRELTTQTLMPVVNATGVVLHTNLGRAPLGREVIDEIARIASGYSSLEFDPKSARRGNRKVHVRETLKLLTGADDALVVNNNAAGLILSLSTLAKDKEVIISRGELIEIGGSFRIPDIMAASGAKMVEVGTTNRTRASDYEAAISENTALVFKAHTSNYAIKGFTEDVAVKELADLAHQHELPMMYDIGSGLLRRPKGLPLESEPDVKSALADGADLVAFSGDKLLGGPQAGILVGKKELIDKLSRAPMMRALRVCKMTYAALSTVCRQYFQDEQLIAANPTFAMLERGRDEMERLADTLLDELSGRDVAARKVESTGQCGGGTLPDLSIPTIAVEILPADGIARGKQTFAEVLFHELLKGKRPILGILREGRILFDMLTVFEGDISFVAESISRVLQSGERS